MNLPYFLKYWKVWLTFNGWKLSCLFNNFFGEFFCRIFLMKKCKRGIIVRVTNMVIKKEFRNSKTNCNQALINIVPGLFSSKQVFWHIDFILSSMPPWNPFVLSPPSANSAVRHVRSKYEANVILFWNRKSLRKVLIFKSTKLHFLNVMFWLQGHGQNLILRVT